MKLLLKLLEDLARPNIQVQQQQIKTEKTAAPCGSWLRKKKSLKEKRGNFPNRGDQPSGSFPVWSRWFVETTHLFFFLPKQAVLQPRVSKTPCKSCHSFTEINS